MKIVINTKYSQYRDFVESIPQNFNTNGRTIYKGRNEIKIFEVNNQLVNVKRYKVPFVFNRIIYTFFRASKVVRAYRYALRITEQGFNTPTPIAYIVEKKWGLIRTSYLITFQSPLSRNFYEFGNGELDERRDILVAFAKFAAQLHNAGIYHLDFSPGNILFDKIDGEISFCLVDINRMSFGDVSMKKGCANFARLWGKSELFHIIASEYARARGFDEEECTRLVLEARSKFWKKFRSKHPVKFDLDI